MVTLISGPPIDTGPPPFADYDSLAAAVADDLDDTTGEYDASIRRNILAAIRWCERDVYYFNERRDLTFLTVDGQEWYGSDDNSEIPTLVRITAAWTEDASGQRSDLRPMRPEVMEGLADNTTTRGEPSSYVYFGQQIRLHPIPGETVFTVRLQVGPYRLFPLINGDDANAWTIEAYDMIKAYTKYLMYKDVLKDAALAAEAFNDYNNQSTALKGETSKRNGTGQIRPTCF